MTKAIKSRQSKEFAILHKESDKLLLAYSEKNSNSENAFWKLIKLMECGYEPIFDSIYHCFSDQLKNGHVDKVLNKKLQESKVLTVGKQFLSLQYINRNNDKFSSAVFTNKKLVLVDFFIVDAHPAGHILVA